MGSIAECGVPGNDLSSRKPQIPGYGCTEQADLVQIYDPEQIADSSVTCLVSRFREYSPTTRQTPGDIIKHQPLLVVCRHCTRISSDIYCATSELSGMECYTTHIIIVIHNKQERALPVTDTMELLNDEDFQRFGCIVDLAFLEDEGQFYECDMNKKGMNKLKEFLQKHVRVTIEEKSDEQNISVESQQDPNIHAASKLDTKSDDASLYGNSLIQYMQQMSPDEFGLFRKEVDAILPKYHSSTDTSQSKERSSNITPVTRPLCYANSKYQIIIQPDNKLCDRFVAEMKVIVPDMQKQAVNTPDNRKRLIIVCEKGWDHKDEFRTKSEDVLVFFQLHDGACGRDDSAESQRKVELEINYKVTRQDICDFYVFFESVPRELLKKETFV